MRILYVAGNRDGSYEQLKRYLPLFKNSNHTFKISGYKKSLKEINADFCLDALLNFIEPNGNISFNGNFSYYTKELNKFNPDLIISDFDIYTSIYATDKNIPLWQVSPALLYYALPDQTKRNIGIHKYNLNLISKDRRKSQYIKSILNHSEKRLVLSHLCDIECPPEILDGYEWCRPEFELDKILPSVNNGSETCLSDCFYNQKFAKMKMKDVDIENITGIHCNIYFKLGQLETSNVKEEKINILINDKIKFLMDYLK